MSGIIGQGVTLRGYYDPAKSFTWNISGAVNKATDIGKAVSQDTTAPSTAKLATDGARILGTLGSYEDRVQEGVKVGTVNHSGGFGVPYTGALAVGDFACGSPTPGVIRKVTDGAFSKALVVEVDAVNSIAVILIV